MRMSKLLLVSLFTSSLSLAVVDESHFFHGVLHKDDNISSCLRSALKGRNPLERDRNVTNCVTERKNLIDFTQCIKVAQTLEFASHEDSLRAFCLEDIKASEKINFHQCFQVARNMEFPENSDQAQWACLQRFERKISKNDCSNLAQTIHNPSLKNRILNGCLTQ